MRLEKHLLTALVLSFTVLSSSLYQITLFLNTTTCKVHYLQNTRKTYTAKFCIGVCFQNSFHLNRLIHSWTALPLQNYNEHWTHKILHSWMQKKLRKQVFVYVIIDNRPPLHHCHQQKSVIYFFPLNITENLEWWEKHKIPTIFTILNLSYLSICSPHKKKGFLSKLFFINLGLSDREGGLYVKRKGLPLTGDVSSRENEEQEHLTWLHKHWVAQWQNT